MTADGAILSFRDPRLGPGMMWDAARDYIVANGGEVLMGHALKQLASDGAGGWRLSTTATDGSGCIVTAANAISSAPMRELAAALASVREVPAWVTDAGSPDRQRAA